MATKKRTTSTKSRRTSSASTGFKNLPLEERRRIAATLVGSMRRVGAFSRSGTSGYKTVTGPDQANRTRVTAETGGEDKVLDQNERNRLITMARNLARNSDALEGILHQFEVNVVGVNGGKAVFTVGDKAAEEKLRESFAAWACGCEFFDDLNLQKLLKLALRTQIIGGNLVFVFDDDLVEDSGKVIAFEPDCIGNIDDGDFARLFPNYRQTQGIIKTRNSRTVGVIVSWSQRGQSVYDLKGENGALAAWPLIKPDPNADWTQSPFIIHRCPGRFNQGHGYSGLWPALATLSDLTDVKGFEVQAAKKNSQTIAQVTQAADEPEADVAAELDPDAQAPIVNADDASAAVQAATDEQIPLDLDEIDAAGVIYDVLPPSVKMEMLDTKHPNPNMPQFINWLQGSSAWAKGLGRVYAHGEANSSYSAAMMEMLLTQKSFDDEWHNLECGILDWIIPQWFRWACRKDPSLASLAAKLPRGWMRKCVSWQRPVARAINPVDEQNALNSGLKNGTRLYREFYGPDWKSKLLDFAEEIEFCRDHSIPHLALQTVSGQIIGEDGKPQKPEGQE